MLFFPFAETVRSIFPVNIPSYRIRTNILPLPSDSCRPVVIHRGASMTLAGRCQTGPKNVSDQARLAASGAARRPGRPRRQSMTKSSVPRRPPDLIDDSQGAVEAALPTHGGPRRIVPLEYPEAHQQLRGGGNSIFLF